MTRSKRQHTRQQMQQRLGGLGLEHLPPAERDELVLRAFLTEGGNDDSTS